MNWYFIFGLPYITVIIFWLATVFITDIELDKIHTTKKYVGKDDFSWEFWVVFRSAFIPKLWCGKNEGVVCDVY